MSGYKLYGRSGSGSLAVQIALEEIGVPYERIWVGRESRDVEEFRKINPAGKVPALRLPDGTMMFESAAILIHLATGQPRLAPTAEDPRHPIFLQWMVYLSANVYEAVLRVYYAERYSSRGAEDATSVRAKGVVDLQAALELISRTLNPYVLGATFSIADAYLYMLTSWWEGDKAELFATLPRLAEHAALVSARPTVEKVEADHAQ